MHFFCSSTMLAGNHFLTLQYSICMRNVCVPGSINQHEWGETVAFYLEMKKEEAEMHKQNSDQISMVKSVRDKKLKRLSMVNIKIDELGGGGNVVLDGMLPLLRTVQFQNLKE